ncbi:MAG: DUF5106 domain-containing protein [Bacteroidales bacterium]|nr:DUF5106 domain-containing protein [Bacteroidales bacterium]
MKSGLGVILVASAILSASCSGSRSNNDTQSETREALSPLASLFRSIDYSDTVSLSDERVMTRIMVDIVKLMPYTDSLTTSQELKLFLNNISSLPRSIAIVDSLGDLYLNNPASPVRDNELYIRFLRAMLSTDSIADFLRLRSEENLRIASLNREGTIANNISILDRNGLTRDLHSINAPHILLVFYDPECPHCSEILAEIAACKRINELIKSDELMIFAVYAEGNRSVWERTKADMPDNWIVGYDMSGVLDNELYSLPAMPVIYLLDSDRRVLLKDPEFSTVLQNL